jgi:glycosyltransferase involved in cell wall biosynthesis
VNVFIAVNQDLADKSAHALYCLRSAFWLAQANPDLQVSLLHPGKLTATAIYKALSLHPPENLSVESVFSIRKTKGRRGFTVNAIFIFFLKRRLLSRAKPGDWLIVPSFPKMLGQLSADYRIRRVLSIAAEVHQLAELDYGTGSPKAEAEWRQLKEADLFITTTAYLQNRLLSKLPGANCLHLPLATGFHPSQFLPYEPSDTALKIGYFGSLYPEQGVHWLLDFWPMIQKQTDAGISLRIVGGSEAETRKLRALADFRGLSGVEILEAVAQREIPDLARTCGVLIIPALAVGRMPFVALTKAYDYLAFRKPIVAANLTSIKDVLIHERNALLFQAGSVESLVKEIQRLRMDTQLGMRLAAQASQDALKYGWVERSKAYGKILCNKGKA